MTRITVYVWLIFWHPKLCICNSQRDVQNAKHYTIIVAHLQPIFKFWSTADHTGYLILAAKH
jgi:hypothetical protein